jgi:hypothetical protein
MDGDVNFTKCEVGGDLPSWNVGKTRLWHQNPTVAPEPDCGDKPDCDAASPLSPYPVYSDWCYPSANPCNM